MARRALLSVSDKTGITELAKGLQKAGFEIISTGGTYEALKKDGVKVIGIEEVTGFPECFSGRVKTMHPLIMGGILFRREDKEHVEQAKKLKIEPIDVIVVNLYPFEETLKKNPPLEELIEQIDIGGPTLLRSAAKNFKHITVVCDCADYDRVLNEIQENGDTSMELRKELATKVFLRTAAYDSVITGALSEAKNEGLLLTHGMDLRYGENPHQWGKFYELYGVERGWKVVQEEKQMSYLNILDADGAWNLVREFDEPTAACIKHANPSGVATHEDITEAFQRCYDADKLSAFGVIVALNRPCTADIIQKIIDQKIFTEVIIAPSYEAEALKLLKEKPKIRAISCELWAMGSKAQSPKPKAHSLIRTALGGVLVQEEDLKVVTKNDLKTATSIEPTTEQVEDLLFAWKVVKHAKSNAIVFAKDKVTVGIGCGQTSRVDSTFIAGKRAGDRAKGAVMASDAFFPFPDSVEEAAKHGIAAIIQPGGSVKDEEVIAKANELKIPMVLTGVRGFKH